jgi:hypothetical protein
MAIPSIMLASGCAMPALAYGTGTAWFGAEGGACCGAALHIRRHGKMLALSIIKVDLNL